MEITPRDPSIPLRIAHTWDGHPLTAEEIVVVRARATATHLHLEIDAPFHGDPPPAGPPGATDGLWDFEVVELFVVEAASVEPGMPPAAARYTEIEFGPHGHHLVLRLEGVRGVVEKELAIDYSARVEGARWRGAARIDRGLLPAGPYRVNAFAIHGAGASRRFLAATPTSDTSRPGAAPDFHRPWCFPRMDPLRG